MRAKLALICISLAIATALVYGPVRDHKFVNYDDPLDIYENPHITHGLTPASVAWAFTTGDDSNWIPLTRLSWMLDWQLFERTAGAPASSPGGRPQFNAGPHHLVDLGLHIASGILLFLILTQMTRRVWPSAFVAALFLLHPLHVESVAWAVERKDTLSGLFWMLTLGAYLRYVRRPGAGRYVILIAMFALGLLAKPMLVTLPLVLLLLDWWPLNRIAGLPEWLRPVAAAGPRAASSAAISAADSPAGNRPQRSSNRRDRGTGAPRGTAAAASEASAFRPLSFGRLIIEKTPLLVLALASSIITYRVQAAGGAVSDMPPFARMGNAVLAYVTYVGKTIVPVNLAVLYPFDAKLPPAWIAGAAMCLAVATFLAVILRRERPYATVGWFWFLGTLVPVIGLVQVGSQAMADRYTYLPLIGLFIAAAWGAADLAARWRLPAFVPAAAGAAIVAACAVATSLQLTYWTDTEALLNRALLVTERNGVAENNLGDELAKQGHLDAAIDHFKRAIEFRANYPEAHYGLGNALAKRHGPGDTAESIRNLREAVRIWPKYAEAHNNLGVGLAAAGQTDEAIAEYKEAIARKPEFVDPYLNLGIALAAKGDSAAAIASYREAIQRNPYYAEARIALGVELARRNETDKAIAEFREAIRMNPLLAEAHFQLGRADGAAAQSEEAVTELREALRLQPDFVDARLELGRVLARQGRMDEAIVQFREAIRAEADNAEAHYLLAQALATQSLMDEATHEFREAIRASPSHADAQFYLGMLLIKAGRTEDAASQFRKVLHLRPDWPPALLNLAQIRACAAEPGLRSGDEAISLAEQACRLTGRSGPAYLDTLAAAFAEAGRFKEAVDTAKEAITKAKALGHTQEVPALEARLKLYESGHPYRLEPAKP
jgi:tetratricopeptide (TPR) repeat protein